MEYNTIIITSKINNINTNINKFYDTNIGTNKTYYIIRIKR